MNNHIFIRLSVFIIFVFLGITPVFSQKLDLNLLEVLGFRVGGTKTLHDVMVRLGMTRSWHTGDASESESKICYRIPSTRGEIMLVFASNGEMSTPKGQVNSIRIISPEIVFSERRYCSLLHLSADKLSTPNGLHLGISVTETQAIFGAKHPDKNGSLRYDLCQKRYFLKSDPAFKTWIGKSQCFEDPSRPYVDDCGFLQIDFSHGHAVFIRLDMIQSVC